MMGRHHVITGVGVGIGLALAILGPAHPREGLCLVLTAGGAAVIADLDEPGSSAAHLGGFLSVPVAWATGKLSGGHRHASHSLLAAVVFTGAVALVVVVGTALGAALVVGLLGAFAWRVGGPRGLRGGAFLLGAAGAGAYLGYVSSPGLLLLAAAGLGYLIHLVGDIATTGGVPLLWPTDRHIQCPVLGDTGSLRESVVSFAIAVLVALCTYHLYAAAVSSLIQRFGVDDPRRLS